MIKYFDGFHMADIANLALECKCLYKSTYSANKNTLYELLLLTSFAPSHCGLNIEVDDTHYAHTGCREPSKIMFDF